LKIERRDYSFDKSNKDKYEKVDYFIQEKYKVNPFMNYSSLKDSKQTRRMESTNRLDDIDVHQGT
jgi:hypothetical protein